MSRGKLAKFSAKLVANFRRSLEEDFRASFAGENRQKHFPPKLHRKFHHQTSLRGSGLWWALKINSGSGGPVPSGPKLPHYITLLFGIYFSDYVINFYIAELASNY